MYAKIAKVLAVVLLAGFLGSLRPDPVRADAEEALLYSGVAIVGYVALVVAGTALVYRRGFLPSERDLLRDTREKAPARRFHAGSHCPQGSSGAVTLVCW